MKSHTQWPATLALLGLVSVASAFPARAQEPGSEIPGGAPQRTSPETRSPFLGGVPHGEATAEPLALSLREAIDQALAHNLGVLLQEQGLETARGSRWQSLSGLLPDVSARVGEARRVSSLAEFGFTEFPGLTSSTVGPFNVFDTRVVVSQPVLDISALNEARAGRALVTAATHDVKNARELVVLVVANLYLSAVANANRVDTARAALETADALFRLTNDLKASGIAAGIDVLRTQVREQADRRRLVAAENDAARARLQLVRAVGLPPGQDVRLTDAIPYAPMQQLTLEEALARAYSTRPDYLAAQALMQAAEATDRAARTSRLPSVLVNGEAGRVGVTPSETDFIYGMSAAVRIPVFEHGRQQARIATAAADLQRRRALLADMRGSIDFDVRSAFLDVRAAEQFLEAARVGRDLAGQQLVQARDRFGAGVAGSLEVVQSQEALAAANDSYTFALYAHNIAKATLARAVGVAEDATKAFLGGPH
jgi:outer membrane protein TolC